MLGLLETFTLHPEQLNPSAILPVLAGWVGTVLAFYFSASSHERTSSSLDKVIMETVVNYPVQQRLLVIAEKKGFFGGKKERNND